MEQNIKSYIDSFKHHARNNEEEWSDRFQFSAKHL